MPTPPLSEVKALLREFPPRPDKDDLDCAICLSGIGRSKCRDAAVELVRETAGVLGYGRLVAPLAEIALYIEAEDLWDEYPEYVAAILTGNNPEY